MEENYTTRKNYIYMEGQLDFNPDCFCFLPGQTRQSNLSDVIITPQDSYTFEGRIAMLDNQIIFQEELPSKDSVMNADYGFGGYGLQQYGHFLLRSFITDEGKMYFSRKYGSVYRDDTSIQRVLLNYSQNLNRRHERSLDYQKMLLGKLSL